MTAVIGCWKHMIRASEKNDADCQSRRECHRNLIGTVRDV